MTGATYYLVYPAPGRPTPHWERYGQLLLDDGQAVLLRAAPSAAERLAAAGAEIVLVTLTPKPLRPVATASFPPVTVADPLVRSMIDQVSQTKLEQYVRALSGELAVIIGGESYTIATRHTDSGIPIQKAAQYVGDHLGGLGLTVESHQWHPTRPPNVIGQIRRDDSEPDLPHRRASGRYARWNDCARRRRQRQRISGRAGCRRHPEPVPLGLHAALRLLDGRGTGIAGQRRLCSPILVERKNIAGVLNLDMIAWNTAGSTPDIDLHAKSALPATVDLANQFKSVVTAYGLNLTPQVITDGPEPATTRRSGIKAIQPFLPLKTTTAPPLTLTPITIR